jgi:hypothetical protein
MKHRNAAIGASFLLSAALLGSALGVRAETTENLLRETLRQQSAAGRSSCAGVQRTLAAGTDATLVVRTAVELGYNSCQVLRCALEGELLPDTDKTSFCEKVIRGAVAAGVQSDVISRCAAESCGPTAVAALLADILLEPNYCYFSPPPLEAPATPPPSVPVFDRSTAQAQASPFTF